MVPGEVGKLQIKAYNTRTKTRDWGQSFALKIQIFQIHQKLPEDPKPWLSLQAHKSPWEEKTHQANTHQLQATVSMAKNAGNATHTSLPYKIITDELAPARANEDADPRPRKRKNTRNFSKQKRIPELNEEIRFQITAQAVRAKQTKYWGGPVRLLAQQRWRWRRKAWGATQTTEDTELGFSLGSLVLSKNPSKRMNSNIRCRGWMKYQIQLTSYTRQQRGGFPRC